MTAATWAGIWFYWLLGILWSFLVLEGGSIWLAHATRQKHIEDWTLSDTIRRWNKGWRPLAMIVCGCVAALMVHFFGTPNP